MLFLSQTEGQWFNTRRHLSAEVHTLRTVLQEGVQDGKGSNLPLNPGIVQHLQQPDSKKAGWKHVKQGNLQNTSSQPCHHKFVLSTANQFQSKSEMVLGFILGQLFTHQLFLSLRSLAPLFSPPGLGLFCWHPSSGRISAPDPGTAVADMKRAQRGDWAWEKGLHFPSAKHKMEIFELLRKRLSLVYVGMTEGGMLELDLTMG